VKEPDADAASSMNARANIVAEIKEQLQNEIGAYCSKSRPTSFAPVGCGNSIRVEFARVIDSSEAPWPCRSCRSRQRVLQLFLRLFRSTRISANSPPWARSGTELYYVGADGKQA
jgi:hypothetical protein